MPEGAQKGVNMFFFLLGVSVLALISYKLDYREVWSAGSSTAILVFLARLAQKGFLEGTWVAVIVPFFYGALFGLLVGQILKIFRRRIRYIQYCSSKSKKYEDFWSWIMIEIDSEKLESRIQALRKEHAAGSVAGKDFLKSIFTLTQMALREKKIISRSEQKDFFMLTDLFNQVKNNKTPKLFENILKDIDGIARLACFSEWQNAEDMKARNQDDIRKLLSKYELENDEELFGQATEYLQAVHQKVL